MNATGFVIGAIAVGTALAGGVSERDKGLRAGDPWCSEWRLSTGGEPLQPPLCQINDSDSPTLGRDQRSSAASSESRGSESQPQISRWRLRWLWRAQPCWERAGPVSEVWWAVLLSGWRGLHSARPARGLSLAAAHQTTSTPNRCNSRFRSDRRKRPIRHRWRRCASS